jgi:cell wall-associated NlpC family hydrolase
MSNYPLAFAELLAGAILIDYGVKAFQGGLQSAGAAGSSSSSAGAVTSSNLAGAPAKVQAMNAMAKSLVGLPYVWGGGHSGWGRQLGYDCSGFVSAVLHAAGYLSSPQSTQTLPDSPGILAGAGQYVTIYDKTNGGSPSNDHVIIDIAGNWFESGGGSGSGNPTGGVSQIPAPSAGYLTEFDRILHPQGL